MFTASYAGIFFCNSIILFVRRAALVFIFAVYFRFTAPKSAGFPEIGFFSFGTGRGRNRRFFAFGFGAAGAVVSTRRATHFGAGHNFVIKSIISVCDYYCNNTETLQ